jgi:predicted methyltransferase
MLVSGIPMHRIKGVDPHRDTLKKIKAVAPVYGEVLDTATGLGYTAIEASRTADNVVTVELDPLSLEIAKQNPWSARLFTSANIQQIVGDVYDVIEEIDSERFSCVIHDPPMFNLAGDLYSREFYTEIFRVLKRRGRVFHYIGDLTSKSGQGVVRGASQRLLEVGFSRVQKRPEAFGIVAYK